MYELRRRCFRVRIDLSPTCVARRLADHLYSLDFKDPSIPPVYTGHSTTALTISRNEAERFEATAKQRLLSSRRLTLVVDLDQTLIQAAVDPTVGEWIRDVNNPNYEALKDVSSFGLREMVQVPGTKARVLTECVYYIKPRPGLHEFLEKVSKLYELHVYTMGARTYADKVMGIIDPQKKYFGDRILSRDESGNLQQKSLQRLFPVDTKMVAIIDDRGDVWQWSDNLIRVRPFQFFVGCGDINATPSAPNGNRNGKMKKNGGTDEIGSGYDKDINDNDNGTAADDDADRDGAGSLPTRRPSTLPEQFNNEPKSESLSEQFATMAGGVDNSDGAVQKKVNQHHEILEHQFTERPLLRMQRQLEAEDRASSSTSSSSSDEAISSTDSASDTQDRTLLRNDDTQLYSLQDLLDSVHRNYYQHYDDAVTAAGPRGASLKSDALDPSLVPDMKMILPSLRSVLKGVSIVFSGIIPMQQDYRTNDLTLWSRWLGARVFDHINPQITTHLVASRPGTGKFFRAARYPQRIKIVNRAWLDDSLAAWKHLDETPYLIPTGMSEEEARLAREQEDGSDTQAKGENSEGDGAGDYDNAHLREDLEVIENDILESAVLNGNSPLGINDAALEAFHDEWKEFMGSDAESASDGDEDGDEDGDDEDEDEQVTGEEADANEKEDGENDEVNGHDDDHSNGENNEQDSKKRKRDAVPMPSEDSSEHRIKRTASSSSSSHGA